jgi:hypothetical protein
LGKKLAKKLPAFAAVKPKFRTAQNLFAPSRWFVAFDSERALEQPPNCLWTTWFVRLLGSPIINSIFQIWIKPQANRLADAGARPSTASLFFPVIGY